MECIQIRYSIHTMEFTAPTFRIRDFSEEHLFDFGTKAAALLTGFAPGDLLAQQAEALTALNQELGQKIGRLSRNPSTEAKVEADQRRDFLKVRLYEATRIAREDPESESIRQAAAVVQEVLNRRPTGFQHLIHAENSTELNLLLSDLAEPKVKQAAAEAGLTKWVTALTAAQDTFTDTERRFDEYDRVNRKPRSIEEIRRDYNEVLRLLLDNLAWAANRLGPASDYAVKFRGLRSELVALQALARTRVTRREKREKKAALAS
jgi:hypothetical protein